MIISKINMNFFIFSLYFFPLKKINNRLYSMIFKQSSKNLYAGGNSA